MKMVALIPARAGSKRIPGKNTKLLAGHPLIAYTIAAAEQSGIFEHVCICTEDAATMAIVRAYDAGVIPRAPNSAGDDESDIVWVRNALAFLRDSYDFAPERFAILRPTSPFRTSETIGRAYDRFRKLEVHSMRAVEPAKCHPGKMWFHNGPGYPMTPVCDAKRSDGTPWHSSPTQTLPPVYVQNASLEMAWTYVVNQFGTISGTKIAPFFTEGYEGFDINDPEDWVRAEALVASGLAVLPSVRVGAQAPTPHSV